MITFQKNATNREIAKMNGWFNYRTGKMEYIDTPADFIDYMPQDVPHQMLYKLYQEHEGLDPIHAFIKVMEKSASVEAEQQSVK